jgi:hypothetical protein
VSCNTRHPPKIRCHHGAVVPTFSRSVSSQHRVFDGIQVPATSCTAPASTASAWASRAKKGRRRQSQHQILRITSIEDRTCFGLTTPCNLLGACQAATAHARSCEKARAFEHGSTMLASGHRRHRCTTDAAIAAGSSANACRPSADSVDRLAHMQPAARLAASVPYMIPRRQRQPAAAQTSVGLGLGLGLVRANGGSRTVAHANSPLLSASQPSMLAA